MNPQRAGEVFWSLPNLAMVTQGKWLRRPSNPTTQIRGLSIDTRTLQPGQAYLALKGENHDGHAFLQQAIDAGASLLIVDNTSDVSHLEDFVSSDAIASPADEIAPSEPFTPQPHSFSVGADSDQPQIKQPESDSSVLYQFPSFAVEESDSPKNHGHHIGILIVENTLLALQELARAWRDVLCDCNNKIIAVAGSNGKTSTRHLIHTLMHGRMVSLDRSPANTGEVTPPKHNTPAVDEERPDLWRLHQLVGTQSPKSFNNHIGVPLTLLAALPEHDFTVVEVGTNHPGEVDVLGRLIEPDAIVLTSIGREHLEFFGNLNGVAKEEASLLAHLKPGGVIVLEREAAKRIAPYASPPRNHHRITYGGGSVGDQTSDASLHIERFVQYADGMSFDVMLPGQKLLGPINVPLIGYHNAVNLLAAIAVAKWMGVDDIQLNLGFLAITPTPGRLEPRVFEETLTTVIHDAYNANPDSLRAALDVLEGLATGGDEGYEVVGAIHSSDDLDDGNTLLSGAGSYASGVKTSVKQPCTVVLGDMLELGEHEAAEHDAAAARVGDMLQRGVLTVAVFVGPRMCEAAAGLKEEAGLRHKVHLYPEWPKNPGVAVVARGIAAGQTILLKGSNAMRLGNLMVEFERNFE
ncbi:UDP-N-acetylmuramoyl-tripeptide--D-alanyl-D-alanine ligase MurF [Poriferisphaera corsica]|uniref:UDP-N-acetylmuramoyl-tripeptide--D-alanyl-D-alanine ligase n=1 Tax=Poriferisphaera corsica TaxID=2528020 RepID=A0A517YZ52_9BACT|nr:UDP-N-acetylmuramoyl-tripeptide--D-alanyl-D-alanine ligase [Poriferisphaera corsica]QDU35502.1 UDP-N-acetylmuramoyl-tripeptide--D-alanyl-D-alanine ligase MurF [Poriferisphaera corsica]